MIKNELNPSTRAYIIVIYLQIDKSDTIYLKLLSRFPNSQIKTS